MAGVTKVGTSPNADLLLSGKGTGEVQVTSPTRIQNTLTVQGVMVQGCRAGFTPISDGRLCISGIQGPQRMHNGAGSANANDVNDGAIANCRSLRARVCTHLEIHQACADGTDAYAGLDASGAGSNFWYGDTVGDNTYIFAPPGLSACSQTDNYGTPANGITGSAKFRCCY